MGLLCTLEGNYDPYAGGLMNDTVAPGIEEDVPKIEPSSPVCIDDADGSIVLPITTDFEGDDRAIETLDRGADELSDGRFIRADSNFDGIVDISDAVFSLASLFIPGSDPPECQDAVDANDDGAFDISDPIYTLAYLFILGSPAPPAPTPPTCFVDPTPDALSLCSTSRP